MDACTNYNNQIYFLVSYLKINFQCKFRLRSNKSILIDGSKKCSTNQSALNEDIVQLHGKFLYSIGLVAILFYFAWPFLEAITRWLIHSCQSCFMNKEKEGFGYFCFKTSFWSSAFFLLKNAICKSRNFHWKFVLVRSQNFWTKKKKTFLNLSNHYYLKFFLQHFFFWQKWCRLGAAVWPDWTIYCHLGYF